MKKFLPIAAVQFLFALLFLMGGGRTQSTKQSPLSLTPQQQHRHVQVWDSTGLRDLPPVPEPQSRPGDLYVFVSPPASFMYQHISLVLELWKRQVGNVLVLTISGYAKPFESQARWLLLQQKNRNNAVESVPPDHDRPTADVPQHRWREGEPPLRENPSAPTEFQVIIWSMSEIPLYPYTTAIDHTKPLPLEHPALNRWGMPKSPWDGIRQMDTYVQLLDVVHTSFEAALHDQDPQLHLADFCRLALSSRNSTTGPVGGHGYHLFSHLPNQCDDDQQPASAGRYGQQVDRVVQLYREAPRKLFVVPGFLPMTLDFCRRLEQPCVSMIPTAMWADLMEPRFISPYHHSVEMRQSWTQRVVDLTRSLYMKAFMYDNPLALQFDFRGPRVLQLIFSHPALASPRSLPPSMVFTGAVVAPEREDPRHLSPAALQLLESGLPVIYVSFGTHAVLDDKTFSMVAEGLLPPAGEEARWGVLWALPLRQRKNLSQDTLAKFVDGAGKAVLFESWSVTPAVLAHPAVRLFASHCGGNSLGEALRAGKAVLGLPATAEQPWNCAVASRNLEFVSCHALWNTSSDEITTTVERVLFEDGSQTQKAAERMKLLTKRAYPGAPLAADWLEFAIAGRNVDTVPLITRDDKMGIVKANYLDLAGWGAAVGGCVLAATGYWAGRWAEKIEAAEVYTAKRQ